MPSFTPVPFIPPFSGNLPTQADIANYEADANRFMQEFPGKITALNAAFAAVNPIANGAQAAAALIGFLGNWDDVTGPAIRPCSVFWDDATWAALEDMNTPGNYLENNEPSDLSTKWLKVQEDAAKVTYGATTVYAALQALEAKKPFPVGTIMLFGNAAAPVGWTKLVDLDNAAIRIVSGTGGGSGGTANFTAAFASRTPAGTVGNTTLTTAQIPAHNHGINIYANPAGGALEGGVSAFGNTRSGTAYGTFTDGGTGGPHNHSFTGTPMDFAVKYADMIRCSLD